MWQNNQDISFYKKLRIWNLVQFVTSFYKSIDFWTGEIQCYHNLIICYCNPCLSGLKYLLRFPFHILCNCLNQSYCSNNTTHSPHQHIITYLSPKLSEEPTPSHPLSQTKHILTNFSLPLILHCKTIS